MVVVLSNDEYSDAVSGIIERDYFPSQYEQRCDNNKGTGEKSLTDFHRATTSATTLQIHETLEEKKRANLYKQSLIYTSNRASADINSIVVTAELRNTLFFPVSATTTTEITEGSPTIVSSMSNPSSTMMPPPRKRKKPTTLLLNRNNNNDDSSRTTLKTGKTTNVRSSKLINSSATRFPTVSIHSRRRMSSSKRKNCYKNDHVEQHWEGSTTKSGDDDDDSYFTDLDATTVDSFSIRMELRKAKKTASRKKETPHDTPAPSSIIGSEYVGNNDSSSILNPLVYQLPRESPRELPVAAIVQQRNPIISKASVRHHRHTTLQQGPRQSQHRSSIKSLRSALNESYRKNQGDIHSVVKFK